MSAFSDGSFSKLSFDVNAWDFGSAVVTPPPPPPDAVYKPGAISGGATHRRRRVPQSISHIEVHSEQRESTGTTGLRVSLKDFSQLTSEQFQSRDAVLIADDEETFIYLIGAIIHELD